MGKPKQSKNDPDARTRAAATPTDPVALAKHLLGIVMMNDVRTTIERYIELVPKHAEMVKKNEELTAELEKLKAAALAKEE